MRTIIWICLAAVSIAAFAMMGADKRRARLGRWRIPEATLLLSAALGGSIGALAGMILFHHKTRKPKFYLGVPAILAAQLAAAYLISRVL